MAVTYEQLIDSPQATEALFAYAKRIVDAFAEIEDRIEKLERHVEEIREAFVSRCDGLASTIETAQKRLDSISDIARPADNLRPIDARVHGDESIPRIRDLVEIVEKLARLGKGGAGS